MDKRGQLKGLDWVRLCSLWLLLAMAGAAWSQELYEAEVAVESQQSAERTSAVKKALGEVLIRVTGQRELPQGGAAQSMLDNAERYVMQYRYTTVPDSRPPELVLRVRFDGDAIQQELGQQGLAYWGGSERPDTLIWLAVEDQGRRFIVSAQDESAVRQQLQQAAKQRGIPVLFPLMDLEDQARVRFSDIWGGFLDWVQSASARYTPGVVLIGRLNRSPSGDWVARWNLEGAADARDWTDTDPRLDGLLSAGIASLADSLASSLAVTQTGMMSDAIRITVEDINTLTAYARANNYLASLTAVRLLQVEQVADSTVHFALQLNGALPGLTRTIAIGSVLEPVPAGVPGTFRLRQ